MMITLIVNIYNIYSERFFFLNLYNIGATLKVEKNVMI